MGLRRLTSPRRLTPAAREALRPLGAALPRDPPKAWTILDPAGRLHTTPDGLKPFCLSRGIHPSHLRARGHSRGWRVVVRPGDPPKPVKPPWEALGSPQTLDSGPGTPVPGDPATRAPGAPQDDSFLAWRARLAQQD